MEKIHNVLILRAFARVRALPVKMAQNVQLDRPRLQSRSAQHTALCARPLIAPVPVSEQHVLAPLHNVQMVRPALGQIQNVMGLAHSVLDQIPHVQTAPPAQILSRPEKAQANLAPQIPNARRERVIQLQGYAPAGQEDLERRVLAVRNVRLVLV